MTTTTTLIIEVRAIRRHVRVIDSFVASFTLRIRRATITRNRARRTHEGSPPSPSRERKCILSVYTCIRSYITDSPRRLHVLSVRPSFFLFTYERFFFYFVRFARKSRTAWISAAAIVFRPRLRSTTTRLAVLRRKSSSGPLNGRRRSFFPDAKTITSPEVAGVSLRCRRRRRPRHFRQFLSSYGVFKTETAPR